MTDALFFVPEFGSDDRIELTGQEAHHAAVVKRLNIGECVLLADGRGNQAHAHVERVARDRVVFEISERSYQPEPDPRFVVIQALPKGDRADLAVEALTELGVDEIVPWAAARSVSVWRDDKIGKGVAKWRRTALEAGKQSRRARLPVVSELAGTATVISRIGTAGLAVVLHEAATDSISSLPLPAVGDIVVIVGPEGGISDDELAAFTAAGAHGCRLGPEVMRTSTAGAATLAALSLRIGRWG